ncbi:MAG: hypothetical protein ABIA78_01705 [archaeon]
MKGERGVIFVFLFVMLLANVSAQSCDVVLEGSCSDNIVMWLSDETNAHGSLTDMPNYDYVLCCDFGTGITTCADENDIIRLEEVTNSHAQIPSLSDYLEPVCYEELNCTSKVGDCTASEMPTLALSTDTDAHISKYDDVDATVKICCEGVCLGEQEYYDGDCVADELLYWEESGGIGIPDGGVVEVVVGQTQLVLVLKNSKELDGTGVSFTIYEADLGPDDEIKTINSVVNSGEASALWKILEEDLQKTLGDYKEFYFKVAGVGGSSQIVELDVVDSETFCSIREYCRDYKAQEDCESDLCSVAGASVEINDPSITCGQVIVENGCTAWHNCSCEWRGGVCGPSRLDNLNCTDGNPVVIGACFFNESSADDCEDGLLEYSWKGIYTWDLGNWNTTQKGGVSGWLEDPSASNYWHYDPGEKAMGCRTENSNVIQCPIEALLPFFTWMNIIVIAIIIAVLYVIIERNKKKPKRKGSKKRKK